MSDLDLVYQAAHGPAPGYRPGHWIPDRCLWLESHDGQSPEEEADLARSSAQYVMRPLNATHAVGTL